MARAERLLVVVAHPDDETFGCGSLLAHAHASGATTVVACATRGEAGTPAPGRGLDGVDLATVREGELHRAAQLLGVERVILFDWRDSGMDGEPVEGCLVAAPVDDVAVRIAEVFDELAPTVVVTLDGSDGHRDHAHVRDATLAAVDLATSPPARVYLHCLPRRLMAAWVEALQRDQPGSQHLDLGELGTAEDEITTVIDTTPFLSVREAAIAVHQSQVSPYEVMPADLRRRFLTAEHLRRIVPAWTGGPIESDVFPATRDSG